MHVAMIFTLGVCACSNFHWGVWKCQGVTSNVHSSFPMSLKDDYSSGKLFGSHVLVPYKRANVPSDMLETVYVPTSMTTPVPTVVTPSFVRGSVEPTLCFEPQGLVFYVVLRLVRTIEQWMTQQGLKFSRGEKSPRLQFYTLVGTEILDFLSLLYDSSTPATRDAKKFERYLLLANAHRDVTGCMTNPIDQFQLPVFHVVRMDPRAVIPSKKRASDVGYDLTLISKVKDLGNRTALYDTGLIIQPPTGYYIEVVPRSSLSKSGYMQSNSLGIIDPNYLDTFKVPLTRVDGVGHPSIHLDDSTDELTLPFTGFQLIIRRPYHGLMVECSRDDLVATSRDTGGFGSTGGLNQHGRSDNSSGDIFRSAHPSGSKQQSPPPPVLHVDLPTPTIDIHIQ